MVLDPPGPAQTAPYPRGVGIADARAEVTAHRAANPLALRTPLLLADVVIGARAVWDPSGQALPLASPHPTLALAVSGGRPVTCFGEWVPSGFLPLTVATAREVVACG